mgnify:CR=1 FL=1
MTVLIVTAVVWWGLAFAATYLFLRTPYVTCKDGSEVTRRAAAIDAALVATVFAALAAVHPLAPAAGLLVMFVVVVVCAVRDLEE